MDAFDIETLDFRSDRLVGIEIELDSGGTEFRAPTHLTGWAATTDGSLRNGMEYVLSPALPCRDVLPAIKHFDARVTEARTNITSVGSMHVHVQAHDLTPEQAWNLCRLYTRFQAEIDMLVADSRKSTRRHTYCKPHPRSLTLSEWKAMFNWNSKASCRRGAKRGDRYWTVNCQPISITDPELRSVEFRQQSATRKAVNIYGWVLLCVALMEIAKEVEEGNLHSQVTLESLLGSRCPFTGVKEWVIWRKQYLNQAPTDALIAQAVAVLRNLHGIHHVSRHLNVPLPVAKAVCEAGRARGLLVAEGLHYRAAEPTTVAPVAVPVRVEQLRTENRRLAELLARRSPR